MLECNCNLAFGFKLFNDDNDFCETSKPWKMYEAVYLIRTNNFIKILNYYGEHYGGSVPVIKLNYI